MKFGTAKQLTPIERQMLQIKTAKENLSRCKSHTDKIDAANWIIELQDQLIAMISNPTT